MKTAESGQLLPLREELLKLINERKVTDIRKYNMYRIDHALKNEGSLMAVE